MSTNKLRLKNEIAIYFSNVSIDICGLIGEFVGESAKDPFLADIRLWREIREPKSSIINICIEKGSICWMCHCLLISEEAKSIIVGPCGLKHNDCMIMKEINKKIYERELKKDKLTQKGELVLSAINGITKLLEIYFDTSLAGSNEYIMSKKHFYTNICNKVGDDFFKN